MTSSKAWTERASDNKVCYGKDIKGTRVGYRIYGNYSDIKETDAAEKCNENENCQSFFWDISNGHKPWVLIFVILEKIQTPFCTRENEQDENRGTGATLYIKK